MQQLIQTLEKYRVIPVIAIDKADDALPLADALLEGGLPLAEITFRTAAAADVIRRITEKRPELLVGAGTVLTYENIGAAVDAGAKFGVAPGYNPNTIDAAAEMCWPFIPGVCTPSEIEAALDDGLRVLKFFPAGAMGGVNMLKAISGPYSHTGVRFMPTGGVTETNLADYLALPSVVCCGGTWIASKDDIAAGNWTAVKDRCKRIAEIVNK